MIVYTTYTYTTTQCTSCIYIYIYLLYIPTYICIGVRMKIYDSLHFIDCQFSSVADQMRHNIYYSSKVIKKQYSIQASLIIWYVYTHTIQWHSVITDYCIVKCMWPSACEPDRTLWGVTPSHGFCFRNNSYNTYNLKSLRNNIFLLLSIVINF